MRIREFLIQAGFKAPTESGGYYRTNAIWRNGDGRNVAINKKNGYWIDHAGGQSGTFAQLMRLCGSSAKIEDIQVEEAIIQESKVKYQTFEKSCLSRLKKDYSFYTERGVSKETLETFQCGVAGSGKLYNRICFPIFNFCDQIIGFAGRNLANDSEYPKWQIHGEKNMFLYPAFLNDFCLKAKGEVILVESIGDVLTLWDAGIHNALCLFGRSMSKPLLYYLVKINPDRIIISTNNDMPGRAAVWKIRKRLRAHFLDDKIKRMFPLKNDWGDSSQIDIVKKYGKVISKWKK
jgi:hypothetical protein